MLLVAYHLYHTLPYQAGDLRFHINYVKVTSGLYQRCYIMFGMLFTAITVIFGLVTAYGNPQTSTTDNATTCLLFGLVNIGLLRDFFVIDFKHLERVNMTRDFPVVIYCDLLPLPDRSHLFNLFGYVISSDRVFRAIIDAIMLNQLVGPTARGNTDYVAKIGDAPAIVRAMNILSVAAVDTDVDNGTSSGTAEPITSNDNNDNGTVSSASTSGNIDVLVNVVDNNTECEPSPTIQFDETV